MKKIKKYISLCACCTLPVLAYGQTTNGVDFETADSYKAIGVYDTWENSPFRTGQLQGNVQVVNNHLNEVDEEMGITPNGTKKILAVQRSRFGSNTFGARVDLKNTFELTTTTQYVHVFICTPTSGCVMLVGLGKRRERVDQSPEAEQFWVLSTTKTEPGKWFDAVFPIKGAGGIDIHSLVVVPDCESPHTLTSDFAAYIDEIEINGESAPRFRRGDYVLNFDTDEVSNKSGNYLNSISLNGSAGGDQTFSVGSQNPQLLYRPMLDKMFMAKAGEKLTPAFNFSASWMNGYVYLDRGNDGKFSYELNSNYTIPEGSDIMSYSYVETVENTEGYISDGSKISGNARNFINPPAFTLPADLASGFYRMRFKVDWGNVDPAGRMTTTNSIKDNGGMIVDVMMDVHGDNVSVSTASRNGEVMTSDDQKINNLQVPYNEPFVIKMRPEKGFSYEGVKVTYGYNLNGDSLVHGNPQYFTVTYPAYLFRNDELTLPAEIMRGGAVSIEGLFVEQKGDEPEVEPGKEYPVSFDKSEVIGRDDRKLNSFTLNATRGGSKTVTIPTSDNHVYQNMLSKEVSVIPGDEVNVTVNYTGHSMHEYLYVDLNQDGKFSALLNTDGTPTMSSELLSYTYYEGKNSEGTVISSLPGEVSMESMPSFTLPANLPAGVYRARLKIDWNEIDPSGNSSQTLADNAGYVVDFLLNVHQASHPLEVNTVNGSINGSGYTGLPLNVPCFQSLTIVPTPAASGYEAEFITIRHGHNFDGPQYVYGNRQWSEYTVPVNRTYTIPADSVNGDLVLTANFEPTESAAYKLIYADEFNGSDGSQPADTVWSRCKRMSSTWNRWLSDSEKVIYVKDGKLVARAIPNPDQATDNVPMITGGIQSSGKFSFKYGKIEARILTNPHTGNFPAFWLMPEDQHDGWPTCGEIDIFEQIDNENKAYHTVHSNWTYNLGHKTDPQSSFNETVSMDRYHTYGFEWTATDMKWYVDGRQVGSYTKKESDANALNQGQWPFDKPFYIILNQSVGNGSWAQNADVNHTYETLFDWVRVYQKEDSQVGISTIPETDDAVEIHTEKGVLNLNAVNPVRVQVYDAGGRCFYDNVLKGNKKLSLQQGTYFVNRQKVFIP